MIRPPFLAEILFVTVFEGSMRLVKFFPLSVPFCEDPELSMMLFMALNWLKKPKRAVGGNQKLKMLMPMIPMMIRTATTAAMIPQVRQPLPFGFSAGAPLASAGVLAPFDSFVFLFFGLAIFFILAY